MHATGSGKVRRGFNTNAAGDAKRRGGRGMSSNRAYSDARGLSRLNYMARGKFETRLNLQGLGLFRYPVR